MVDFIPNYDLLQVHELMLSDQVRTKAYQKAIISYQNIRETYPDNHFNDQILFKISQSFLKLGMKKEAKTFLTELIKKYKNSPLTKKAQKILKQLKGSKGNKKRWT